MAWWDCTYQWINILQWTIKLLFICLSMDCMDTGCTIRTNNSKVQNILIFQLFCLQQWPICTNAFRLVQISVQMSEHIQILCLFDFCQPFVFLSMLTTIQTKRSHLNSKYRIFGNWIKSRKGCTAYKQLNHNNYRSNVLILLLLTVYFR